MLLLPLSTNTFTISDYFKGPTREKIQKAVKASKMPDGVQVISQFDTPPPKGTPFVVLFSSSPDLKTTRTLFKAGASDVISTYSTLEEMTENFDSAIFDKPMLKYQQFSLHNRSFKKARPSSTVKKE